MFGLLKNERGVSAVIIIQRIFLFCITFTVLFIIGNWFVRVMFFDSVADSTVKELYSRAIAASSTLIAGDVELSNGTMGNVTKEGFPVRVYRVNKNFFEITLSGIPHKVCQHLIEKDWTVPTSLYINGTLNFKDKNVCQKQNIMSFEFSTDLNEHVSNSEKPFRSHCRSDADCNGCEACWGGFCQTSCNAGETCAKTIAGKDVCCSENNNIDGICCSYIQDGMCCWGRGKCCPMDKPIFLENGQCVDCYSQRVFSVGNPPSLDTCQALCPNRVFYGQDSLCYLPICGSGEFMDMNGDCLSCQVGGGFMVSKAECNKCPNRTYRDGLCYNTCPANTVLDEKGNCISCSAPESFIPDKKEECQSVCSQRYLNGKYCALNECPADFIPDRDGSCHSCKTSGVIPNVSSENCALCVGRENGVEGCSVVCPEGSFKSIYGDCYPCETPLAVPTKPNSLECLSCPERMMLENYCFAPCYLGSFRDTFGGCYSCQSLESRLVRETSACHVCQNRKVQIKSINGQNEFYCGLAYCPENYFADKNGSCQDCMSDQSFEGVSEQECLKCANRVWTAVGQKCQLRSTCKEGEIIDADGKCQSCTQDTYAIFMEGRIEECDKCANRYKFGSWCRMCPTDITTLKDKAGCQKCGGIWDNRIANCSLAVAEK